MHIKRTIYSEGQTLSYWACEIHGDITPICFVEKVRYSEEPPKFLHRTSWACEECTKTHLEQREFAPAKDLSQPKVKTVCSEKACAIVENLEDCVMCGAAICPTHRVEKVCIGCSEAIDREVGNGWHGL
jgi:hypothetical protein